MQIENSEVNLELPSSITLLGTSHVSTVSVREVHEAIPEQDIICVELDRGRAEGLFSGKRATFSEMRAAFGLRTAVMANILRFFQEKIAKQLGVVPGIEMKTAIVAAAKANKKIILIDRDIRITMTRVSASFGRKEIWQLCKDFFRPKKMSFHPSDDVVEQLLGELQQQYPRLYRALVSERDIYMARALVHLAEQNPGKRLLAVVGKGHVPGMLNQIKYLKPGIDVDTWHSSAKK